MVNVLSKHSPRGLSNSWRAAGLTVVTLLFTASSSLADGLALNPADCYRQGRELIEQNRYQEAYTRLSQLPEGDELYPYAAKAIIYCAWACPELDLIETLTRFSQSPYPEISRLAQAALLEEQLSLNELPEGAAKKLDGLIKAAPKDNLSAALALCQIDILRLEGNYEAALQYGRSLEDRHQMSASIRHRAHLQLAKVLYTQADDAAYLASIAAQQSEEEIPEKADLKGMAEETLLQFISSYPDSRLIATALHELYVRHSLLENSYAKEALESWITQDALIHKNRALLSLLCLAYIDAQALPHRAPNLHYVNLALTAFPKEDLSQVLLKDTVRRLILVGKLNEAAHYLELVEQKDTLYYFLQAELFAFRNDEKKALPLFEQCLDQSEGEMFAAALNNAFICAVRLGDEIRANQLLSRADSPALKARLYNSRTALYLKSHPAQAKKDAQWICEHYSYAPYYLDAQLDLIELALKESVELALARLNKLNTEGIEKWSDEQLLRYYCLKLKLAQLAQERRLAGAKSPIDVTRELLADNQRRSASSFLLFHLCYLLSLEEDYPQILSLLQDAIDQGLDKDTRAKALLLSGIAAEQLNTLPSIKQAISFYQQSAELKLVDNLMPLIRAALIQTRIGEYFDAQSILTRLLKTPDLEVSEQCLILGALADVWSSCAGDDAIAIEESLSYCKQMTELEGLPLDWYKRAHLQAATIYARYTKNAEALMHYEKVIDANKKPSVFYSRADWYLNYAAAIGAILTYAKDGQYDKAVELAEKMADMEGGTLQGRFKNWAALLRKERSQHE